MKPKVAESIEEILGEDDNLYYYKRQMEKLLIEKSGELSMDFESETDILTSS